MPADQTLRFLFDNTPIRGELTQLNRTLADVLEKHPYPAPVQRLLGEFLAAAAMLSDTLKFEGTLSLQVRGSGQIRMLMAECRNNEGLRAIAHYNDDFEDQGAQLGEGQLAITIEPDKGKRYQGVVSINDDDQTLAAVLEDYFQQSEQIRTRIWLFASEEAATGFMIQAMPASASESSLSDVNSEDWSRIVHLAETLTDEEALSLPAEQILHRLFHEETVRVFDPRALKFACNCSRERSENAIRMMGKSEAEAQLADAGVIEVDCQFCHSRYGFDAAAIADLFSHESDQNLN